MTDEPTALAWKRVTYRNSDKPIEPARWEARDWSIRLVTGERAEMAFANDKYELSTDAIRCDNYECGSSTIVDYYATPEEAMEIARRLHEVLCGEPKECPHPELHDDVIRCYGDDGEEHWAQFCPLCGRPTT